MWHSVAQHCTAWPGCVFCSGGLWEASCIWVLSCLWDYTLAGSVLKLILLVDTQNQFVYCFYVSLTVVLIQCGASLWHSVAQHSIAIHGLAGWFVCSGRFLGGVMHLGAELLVGLHPCWFSFETHSYGVHTPNLFIVSMFPSQLFLFNLVLYCGEAWHITSLHCMA